MNASAVLEPVNQSQDIAPEWQDTEQFSTDFYGFTSLPGPLQSTSGVDAATPEDQNQQSCEIHFLTSLQKNALKCGIIYTSSSLPEYPETSMNGVAYCVNVAGMDKTMVDNLHLNVQYGKNSYKCSREQETDSHYLGVRCKRTTWKCTGIKCCEYADSTVRSPHCSWIADDWQKKLEQTHVSQRLFLTENNVDEFQEETFTVYYGAQLAFKRRPCADAICQSQGQLQLVTLEDMTYSGVPTYAIVCNRTSRFSPQTHFCHAIKPGSKPINIHLLQQLFESGYQGQIEECYPTWPIGARTTSCGISHPQGSGKLVKVGCGVQFDIIIPLDLQRMPWILWVSRGIHLHNPPPPTRTPQQLLAGLMTIVARLSTSVRNVSQLMVHPEIQQFVNATGRQTLGGVHASFNNRSRLSALLLRERFANWSPARDWAGVQLMMDREPDDNRYIQFLWTDWTNQLIICFTKQMALSLLKQKTFEVDMSFKRIHGTMNEVLFAGYQPGNETLFTYARMYINSDTRVGYRVLFTSFFREVERVTGEKVFWHHIHGKGLHAIVSDMCEKQSGGFGDYLQTIDPLAAIHTPEWHNERTMMFCHVHLKRGIDQSIWKDAPQAAMMKEILFCKTLAETYQLIEYLRRDLPGAKDWLDHKERHLFGININAWQGDKDVWNETRHQSNAVEASHRKSNLYGTGLSIGEGIEAAKKIDLRDWSAIEARQLYHITTSYRAKGNHERYTRGIQKQRSQRLRIWESTKEQLAALNDINPHHLRIPAHATPPSLGALEFSASIPATAEEMTILDENRILLTNSSGRVLKAKKPRRAPQFRHL